MEFLLEKYYIEKNYFIFQKKNCQYLSIHSKMYCSSKKVFIF